MTTEVKEEFYDNGQIESRLSYKDGKRHGLYEWWWENGQLEERIDYKNGKIHGLYEWWWENGKISYNNLYQNDEVIIDFIENPELEPKTKEEWFVLALQYEFDIPEEFI